MRCVTDEMDFREVAGDPILERVGKPPMRFPQGGLGLIWPSGDVRPKTMTLIRSILARPAGVSKWLMYLALQWDYMTAYEFRFRSVHLAYYAAKRLHLIWSNDPRVNPS